MSAFIIVSVIVACVGTGVWLLTQRDPRQRRDIEAPSPNGGTT